MDEISPQSQQPQIGVVRETSQPASEQQVVELTQKNPLEPPTLPNKKKWLFYILVVVLLLVLVTLILNFYRFSKTKEKEVQIPEKQELVIAKPTEVIENKEYIGESIHLFYPTNEVEIVDQQPTFFGKIFQSSELIVDTKFGLEGIPYNQDEQRYYLRFLPGKLKNVSVAIDDEPVTNVYGLPQYPTVQCDIFHPNPDGSSTYIPEAGYYGDSPNLEPLKTEADCVKNKRDILPPILFLFKPSNSLGVGKHTVRIATSGEEKEFAFSIFEKVTAGTITNLQFINKDFPLKIADVCSSGYHYRKDYLHIPIPDYQSKSQFSQLYLPQSEYETITFNKNRVVYLAFDNNIFNLLLPPANVFYTDREYLSKKGLDSNRYLFIPKNLLVFWDNSPISIWKGQGSYYPVEYMELVPVLFSGEIDYTNKLPHQTVGSSSCDG